MSNYRRFITYLFRYENGEKLEQSGYAKIEQRQNTGRIEFHIKNCGAESSEILPYFFAQGGQVQIPIGKLAVKSGLAEGTFRFDCGNMGGTKYHFSDVRGLVIPLTAQCLIISQWDDETYQWEQFLGTAVEGDKEERQADEKQEEERQEFHESSENQLIEDTAASPDTVVEAQETTLNNQPSLSQRLNNELERLRPRQYPFEGDASVWAILAQLRDIRHLPKAYWNLGNNGFVLRGYFNYGSILIGYMEQEKGWFVGVPGVFQNQEKIIASMFGFNRFRGKKHPEEKPGNFGYWYRLLDMVD